MLGKKINSGLEQGYVFAPYITMTTNSVIQEYTSNRNKIRRIKINNIFDLDLDIKDEFSPSKSIMSRYSKKIINNRFYGVVEVKNPL